MDFPSLPAPLRSIRNRTLRPYRTTPDVLLGLLVVLSGNVYSDKDTVSCSSFALTVLTFCHIK